MGRKPNRLYVVGSECFLPARVAGYWIRTHVSAAFVECPQCKAPIGAACRDNRDPDRDVSYTHYVRRQLYKSAPKSRAKLIVLPR